MILNDCINNWADNYICRDVIVTIKEDLVNHIVIELNYYKAINSAIDEFDRGQIEGHILAYERILEMLNEK